METKKNEVEQLKAFSQKIQQKIAPPVVEPTWDPYTLYALEQDQEVRDGMVKKIIDDAEKLGKDFEQLKNKFDALNQVFRCDCG